MTDLTDKFTLEGIDISADLNQLFQEKRYDPAILFSVLLLEALGLAMKMLESKEESEETMNDRMFYMLGLISQEWTRRVDEWKEAAE